MDAKLYLVVLMIVCTSSAITLTEIEKMKRNLDQELKNMVVGSTEKRGAEKIPKKDSEGLQYDQFVKLDISDSLGNLKQDYASEKVATDELKKLIKVEDEKEAKVFDQILKHALKQGGENKAKGSDHEAVLNKIDKEGKSMTPEEIEHAYKQLIELKLKNAGQEEDPPVLSKKEALKAYENLALSSASKDQYKPIGSSNCNDKRKDCERLKKASFCTIPEYRKDMRHYCAYTCEACYRCEDQWGRKTCSRLYKYCKVRKGGIRLRMKRNCYETCGYCKQRSPPACQSKEFRCCWDNSTAKKDPLGTNCPVCKDKYKNLCESFKQLCRADDDSSPGKFIKKHCPKKCGFCDLEKEKGGECMDQNGYHMHCVKWRNLGLCDFKDISGGYCKGTCNKKCHNNHKSSINVP